MSVKAFYAWQSDRPDAVNRYLIRDAIKAALKKLKSDAKVQEAPPFDIDYDTKDEPGTPHIADTIARKIRNCGAFIADMTFVADYMAADGREKKTPNPNVQIELGLAIRKPGWSRILLVMNTAYGKPEDLPFDLKHHSFPIQYYLPDASNAAAVKSAMTDLAHTFAAKLKLILQDVAAQQEREQRPAQAEPGKAGHWTEPLWRKFKSQVLRGTFHGSAKGRPVFALAIFPARKPKPLNLIAIEEQVTRAMPPLGDSNSWNPNTYGRSIVTDNSIRERLDRPGQAPTSATELTEECCIFAVDDLLPGQWKDTGHPSIPLQDDERRWLGHIHAYTAILRRLGIIHRFIVQMMLARVQNMYVLPSNYHTYDGRRFRPLKQDVYMFETMVIDGTDIAKELKPAFDRLWRDAGLQYDPSFDEKGNLR